MKKLSFEANGQKIEWVEKSHAQVFRNFWAHFINEDLDKTLQTIEETGIRTATEPEFIAKNGSRKKHIPVTDGLWVYAHLTPKAMDKLYEKFLFVWNGGKVEQPQETSPDAPSDEVTEPETTPQEELELTPQQKAAITRKRNKEEKERKLAAAKAEREAKEQAHKSQQLSTDEIDNIEL